MGGPTTDDGFLATIGEPPNLYYVAGGGGALVLICIVVVVLVCRSGSDDDDMPMYGSALSPVVPSADAACVPTPVGSAMDAVASARESTYNESTVARAALPPMIAADAPPVVPDAAPPVESNYGRLPDAPLTTSPDAAPDIYAEISNVAALPGMGGPPPVPDGGAHAGYDQQQGFAPAPPRPDMLPPPP